MKSLAIIYGSTGDNTKNVAKKIAEKITGADLLDVASITKADVEKYDNLIIGSSTWGLGDLQDDWDGFLPELKKADLTGKTISLFGLGDSSSYSDTYVDAMGIIFETIKDKGCNIIGSVSTAGYSFDSSRADNGGQFVGLALDEDNEFNKTDDRISEWVKDILPRFQ
ncbi:MAG: flavodoxin [Paludibacteraceae bacterium]